MVILAAYLVLPLKWLMEKDVDVVMASNMPVVVIAAETEMSPELTALIASAKNELSEADEEVVSSEYELVYASQSVSEREEDEKRQDTKSFYNADEWTIDEEGIISFADGRIIYMTLDDIRSNIGTWFSNEEIRLVTLIVMAEDMIAYSDTIWAAHVWCILNRLDSGSFPNTIGTILAQKGQFDTYLPENLAKTPSPEVERIVRDVFARYVYEKIGAPEELVGRVLPSDWCFFRGEGSKYNHFYRYCWGDRYDPFDSPFNPYDN